MGGLQLAVTTPVRTEIEELAANRPALATGQRPFGFERAGPGQKLTASQATDANGLHTYVDGATWRDAAAQSSWALTAGEWSFVVDQREEDIQSAQLKQTKAEMVRLRLELGLEDHFLFTSATA